ncbi:MAG: PEP-CTERM sorting domain-containing protein [Planctomycetota bacterium]
MKTFTIAAALLLAGTTQAFCGPTLTHSQPILLIDGKHDFWNESVTLLIAGTSAGDYAYGQMVGGSFVEFTGSLQTFEDGHVLDLAIRHRATDAVHALSDGNAEIKLLGHLDASHANTPRTTDYYGGARVRWSVGTTDIAISVEPFSGDGVYVPVGAPIPEPATLLLFGVGAAGLGVARRRRQNAA